MVVLDSDILVDVMRRLPAALAWLNSVSTQTVVVPGYVAFEAAAGCRNAAEQRALDRVTSAFRVVWPSSARCDIALEEYKRIHLAHGIGVFDMLIAQTAIELGQPLHTFNVKHFSTVPGLQIVQPYARQTP